MNVEVGGGGSRSGEVIVIEEDLVEEVVVEGFTDGGLGTPLLTGMKSSPAASSSQAQRGPEPTGRVGGAGGVGDNQRIPSRIPDNEEEESEEEEEVQGGKSGDAKRGASGGGGDTWKFVSEAAGSDSGIGSSIWQGSTSTTGSSSDTLGKKYECSYCKKRFTRPSSLNTHIYKHTGEKPFQCDVPGCGKSFNVLSNLRRHLKMCQKKQSKKAAAQPNGTMGSMGPSFVGTSAAAAAGMVPGVGHPNGMIGPGMFTGIVTMPQSMGVGAFPTGMMGNMGFNMGMGMAGLAGMNFATAGADLNGAAQPGTIFVNGIPHHRVMISTQPPTSLQSAVTSAAVTTGGPMMSSSGVSAISFNGSSSSGSSSVSNGHPGQYHGKMAAYPQTPYQQYVQTPNGGYPSDVKPHIHHHPQQSPPLQPQHLQASEQHPHHIDARYNPQQPTMVPTTTTYKSSGPPYNPSHPHQQGSKKYRQRSFSPASPPPPPPMPSGPWTEEDAEGTPDEDNEMLPLPPRREYHHYTYNPSHPTSNSMRRSRSRSRQHSQQHEYEHEYRGERGGGDFEEIFRYDPREPGAYPPLSSQHWYAPAHPPPSAPSQQQVGHYERGERRGREVSRSPPMHSMQHQYHHRSGGRSSRHGGVSQYGYEGNQYPMHHHRSSGRAERERERSWRSQHAPYPMSSSSSHGGYPSRSTRDGSVPLPEEYPPYHDDRRPSDVYMSRSDGSGRHDGVAGGGIAVSPTSSVSSSSSVEMMPRKRRRNHSSHHAHYGHPSASASSSSMQAGQYHSQQHHPQQQFSPGEQMLNGPVPLAPNASTSSSSSSTHPMRMHPSRSYSDGQRHRYEDTREGSGLVSDEELPPLERLHRHHQEKPSPTGGNATNHVFSKKPQQVRGGDGAILSAGVYVVDEGDGALVEEVLPSDMVDMDVSDGGNLRSSGSRKFKRSRHHARHQSSPHQQNLRQQRENPSGDGSEDVIMVDGVSVGGVELGESGSVEREYRQEPSSSQRSHHHHGQQRHHHYGSSSHHQPHHATHDLKPSGGSANGETPDSAANGEDGNGSGWSSDVENGDTGESGDSGSGDGGSPENGSGGKGSGSSGAKVSASSGGPTATVTTGPPASMTVTAPTPRDSQTEVDVRTDGERRFAGDGAPSQLRPPPFSQTHHPHHAHQQLHQRPQQHHRDDWNVSNLNDVDGTAHGGNSSSSGSSSGGGNGGNVSGGSSGPKSGANASGNGGKVSDGNGGNISGNGDACENASSSSSNDESNRSLSPGDGSAGREGPERRPKGDGSMESPTEKGGAAVSGSKEGERDSPLSSEGDGWKMEEDGFWTFTGKTKNEKMRTTGANSL
ncbi:hypothetical protein HK102_000076 [Quaeritorhiza haematococci]|nr:hypothetical protein HK102_000076 [Quaeritorhiza haematococci]